MEPVAVGLQTIEGDWQGTLGDKKRRVVVRIAAADDAACKATFHPIDQTAQPIPIDCVVLESHSLKLGAVVIPDFELTGSPVAGVATRRAGTQPESSPAEHRRFLILQPTSPRSANDSWKPAPP